MPLGKARDFPILVFGQLADNSLSEFVAASGSLSRDRRIA